MRRGSWLLLVLLAEVLPVQAGEGMLFWDDALEWQPGTTYTLHIVTALGGRTVVSEEVLSVQPQSACAAFPHAAVTVETLCSRICLDPGEYRLTITARTRGLTSLPSDPVLDLDLLHLAPCRPNRPIPPPPPLPTRPIRPGLDPLTVAALTVPLTTTALLDRQALPEFLPTLVNPGCVSWKVVGPCFCTPTNPCLQVEYYEPGWLIETVKIPGTTTLQLLGPILQAALTSAGITLAGGGAANASSSTGHTNLHHSEVHVYSFPQLFGGPCTGCAPSPSALPMLYYASELDMAGWRPCVAVPSPLDLLHRVGVWGPLYPRCSRVIHGSAPTASGLTAVRGLDIAFQPVGTPPNVDGHVIVHPSPGFSRCLQMAWPAQTPCIPAGTPPPLWELGTVSARGSYAWIAWRRMSCCIPPNQISCGITLPPLGGHGANMCIIPDPPTP